MTTIAGSLSSVGSSKAISLGIYQKLNVSISGTFNGTVLLERAAGSSGWKTMSASQGPTSYDDIRHVGQYRVTVLVYGSGTISYDLTATNISSGEFTGDAGDVDFDPTGTDLTSTNVESAIVELANSTRVPLGLMPLGLNQTFSEVVAGLTPTKEYIFGTAAQTTHENSVAIRNITDLAAHFDPYQSFAGGTIINSELQNYQAFNTSNHAFLTDRMNLSALLPGNSWTTQVYQVGVTPVNLNGTAIPIANLGMSNTTGLRVGQIVAVQFRGIYYINALVTDTSVSLTQLGGSTTGTQTGNLIVFLPIDSAVLTSTHVGGTNTMEFASLPTITLNTTSIGYATSTAPRNINDDYRVTNVSGGTTVTLNKNTNFGSLAIGTRILFSPSITSGQIWSKTMYDITNPSTFFAVDIELDLYNGADTANPLLVNSSAAYSALPATVPMGAWPSFWIYGGNPGFSVTTNSSEVDFFEGYMSTTIGNGGYVMGTANGDVTRIFVKTNDGWTESSSVYRKTLVAIGSHTISCAMCAYRTYRYVDGPLIKGEKFEWVSQAPVQIGTNLACGTLAPGNGSNLTLPFRPENFTGMTFGVKRLRIWHIPA